MIHKIKALHDDGQGLSIRAIGQELGISRNTVRKYLRQDEATIQAAQSNREREKKLDAHRDYIVYLLRTFPRLSSVKVARKLREKVGQPAAALLRAGARHGARSAVPGGSGRAARGDDWWRAAPPVLRGVRALLLAPDLCRRQPVAARYRHLHPPAR